MGRGRGRRGVFKKGTVSYIFVQTNSLQCYRSQCLVCPNVLCIYSIPNSIVCVSWKEPTLIESNQQIYGFCK